MTPAPILFMYEHTLGETSLPKHLRQIFGRESEKIQACKSCMLNEIPAHTGTVCIPRFVLHSKMFLERNPNLHHWHLLRAILKPKS